MGSPKLNLDKILEYIKAFSAFTSLGCTISDHAKHVSHEFGHACHACKICSAAGIQDHKCNQPPYYGITEKEQYFSRYVYFCSMGLTFFAATASSEEGPQFTVDVGPFLMVEKQDFIDCNINSVLPLSKEKRRALIRALDDLVYVEPSKVTELSTFLYLMLNISNANLTTALLTSVSEARTINRRISPYQIEVMQAEAPRAYPLEKERELLQSFARKDAKAVTSLSNELLTEIIARERRDLDHIKSRVYELLVLLTRTALDNGADIDAALQASHEYRLQLEQYTTVEGLSVWFTHCVGMIMNSQYHYSNARHANIIRRCTEYIQENYNKNITLQEVSRMAYLSPAYLSRIFKQEVGIPFNEYVNLYRVNIAKELLSKTDMRLTDISYAVGYEDQSYFTKVFKKTTGMLPSTYRSHTMSLH